MILLCKNGIAQRHSILHINKIKGCYHKALRLPINIKVITYENQTIIISLDSFSKEYLYYNNSKDSLPIKNVYTIHLRGLRSFFKYSGLAALGIGTLASALFTYYTLNYKVVFDANQTPYIYAGIAYTASFASLSGLLFSLPRTRFPMHKYTFELKH